MMYMCVPECVLCVLFIENKLQFKLISILFTDRIYLGIQQSNEPTYRHSTEERMRKKESKPSINEQRQENVSERRETTRGKKETIEKLRFNFILV